MARRSNLLATGLLDDFRRDFHHGMVSLRRNPGFAWVAVAVLALGTGANAALFSYVDSVLLGRVAYPEADRLVVIYAASPMAVSSSSIDYLAWRERVRAFAQIAAESPRPFNLTTGPGGAERIQGALVSTNYFETLGIPPLIGRDFTAEQEQPGKERVAVVANRLWRAQFGADPEIVGKRVALDGQFYTVAGVLPAGLFDMAPESIYVPLTFRPEQVYLRMTLNVLGRLAPGVTFGQALADMDRVVRLDRHEVPLAPAQWTAVLTPIRDWMLNTQVRKIVAILFAIATLILLIACTNVAGLLVARSASRRREFALRVALGAGRGRLVRQCLTENLPVSLFGGGLGILFAAWLTRTRFESLLSAYFWHGKVVIDARVLGLMVCLVLMNTLLFGAAPAWRSVAEAKGGLHDNLSGARRGDVAAALIVCEVAMTVMLLFGGGLFVRSLVRLLQVDLGIGPTNALTFQIDLAKPSYRSITQVSPYVQRFLGRLASMQSVRAAGVTTTLPLGNEKWSTIVSVEGQTVAPGFAFATPGYLAAAGMRLIKGRWLSALDSAGAPLVAVVTSSFAREYLAGQDPLGKSIVVAEEGGRRRTIVGVVGDVRIFAVTAAPGPGFYLPLEQAPAGYEIANIRALKFIVRTSGEPAKLAPAIRSIATQEDRNQPVYDIATMQQVLGDATRKEHASAVLFAACGGLALLLAALGIYAMLHFTVTQRTREIGVRMAMGATPARVVSMVVRWGIVPVMLGAAAGCICASTVSHLLGSFLFETSPYDPLTYLVVMVATLAISLPATCLPALRAASLDPMRTLHCE
jgi:putative ABC transport system permease protein